MTMRWNRNGRLVFMLVLFFALAAGAVTSLPHATSIPPVTQPAPLSHRTRNVVVVMIDGLRWQEVFQGAEAKQLRNVVPDGLDEPGERIEEATRAFGQHGADERRKALMPFLWTTVDGQGQIFGNRTLGNDVHVSNSLAFSYPGYAETFTGFVDPRVQSNDNVPNPDPTVLEWLNHRPEYRGRVAAIGSWQVFHGIFRSPECGFPVIAGFDPMPNDAGSQTVAVLNALKSEESHLWSDSAEDPLAFHSAIEYVKARKPRVLFLGLGDTDNWAHAGSYVEYLKAIHRADRYVAQLWNLLQSMPEYHDSTTLILLPDHGRGRGAAWTSHGAEVPGAGETWMAFLGPDTAHRGEHVTNRVATESQIAATMAEFLGEDYRADEPRAASAIRDVLQR